MAGSTFGTLFRVTTWGESHGKAVGCVVDGCPAGLELSEELIQPYLDRRKPGQNRYTTKRAESDTVQILSGVFEGKTTGTPISIVVYNADQHSKDYSNIKDTYRPGHADYGFDQKYGFRDYRGGGRSSGRETAARVMAGAVASLLLAQFGIRVTAYTRSIGPVTGPSLYGKQADASLIESILQDPLYMTDPASSSKASKYLDSCMADGDSSGGSIECIASGLPAGIGEPVFDKLDAELAKAIMSIGAVKSVEIGDGILVSSARGSSNNDSFYIDADGKAAKRTNHSGGTLGGMSDGSQIQIRAAVKPTPSISIPQQTINKNGQDCELVIKGRHDPVIVPRAVVVVESMAAVTIADLLLRSAAAKLENLLTLYH
ncbi:MAG: chorismate synthase [Eubacterium sp.]|nr:chorismate synthase [Eubacterium sp.]